MNGDWQTADCRKLSSKFFLLVLFISLVRVFKATTSLYYKMRERREVWACGISLTTGNQVFSMSAPPICERKTPVAKTYFYLLVCIFKDHIYLKVFYFHRERKKICRSICKMKLQFHFDCSVWLKFYRDFKINDLSFTNQYACLYRHTKMVKQKRNGNAHSTSRLFVCTVPIAPVPLTFSDHTYVRPWPAL